MHFSTATTTLRTGQGLVQRGLMAKEKEDEASSIHVVTEHEVWASYEARLVEDAERRANRRRRDRQREVLIDVLLSGRLDEDDLCAMIQIGTVTLDERTLPCEDPLRTEGISEWDARFEAALLAEEDGERVALSPAQHDCPLQSLAVRAATPLPCLEAQRAQLARRALRGESIAGLLDDDDPVVEHELRPCIFLGRELLLSVYLLLDDRRRRLRLGGPAPPPAEG